MLKKARKVIGVKQTKKAVERGEAIRVFLARDAEARLTGPVRALCEASGSAAWLKWSPCARWDRRAASAWEPLWRQFCGNLFTGKHILLENRKNMRVFCAKFAAFAAFRNIFRFKEVKSCQPLTS